MTRRFGPTAGAGTRLEEQEGEKQIVPGALGWVGYGMLLEKGDVGELMLITGGASEFARRCGGIIDDGQGPDAAGDFFDLANGAGGMAVVRVTDGNEVAASLDLYVRNGLVRSKLGSLAAKNGGRWGGKHERKTYDLDAIGDLTETTLQLPAAVAALFTTDQFKGAVVALSAVANKTYTVVSSTNTGLLTVNADQTMLTDHGGGGDLRFYLSLDNEGKSIAVTIDDGDEDATNQFSISVSVDGGTPRRYGNLHTNPTHARYWEDIINNDPGNFEIVATDTFTGTHDAAARPANHYGVISALAALVLTATIHEFLILNSPGGGDPTFALGTTTDAMLDQVITLTMTSPTAFDAVSDKFGALGSGTLGVLFAPNNVWSPPFTVTAGGTPLTAADTLRVTYRPFIPDALIGGWLYPDKVNDKRLRRLIADNTHNTITIAAGADLTADTIVTNEFSVAYGQEMVGGRDGHADITDGHYTAQAWDLAGSPFNDIAGKGLALVKFATPGVTSTVVQKAGKAYAEAKNHQYRYEIPAATVTESAALDYINDTLGRSEYAVNSFPSYGEVPHPDPASAREGKRKTITLTGMIHGREARIANDFNGYHKAGAGVAAILDRLLSIPTGDTKLNEELLNPAGIGVIKKKNGNFVIWGDRTLHVDTNWKWKHQRELMSYYELVLQDSFDFLIFAINDEESDNQAMAALQSFFLPEFVKRAIRGTTFQDAAILKVDAEINTDSTRAAGDKFAEVSLRLADTVERFVIRIGKQGIFEQVS